VLLYRQHAARSIRRDDRAVATSIEHYRPGRSLRQSRVNANPSDTLASSLKNYRPWVLELWGASAAMGNNIGSLANGVDSSLTNA
jgi:hypothetical protein